MMLSIRSSSFLVGFVWVVYSFVWIPQDVFGFMGSPFLLQKPQRLDEILRIRSPRAMTKNNVVVFQKGGMVEEHKSNERQNDSFSKQMRMMVYSFIWMPFTTTVAIADTDMSTTTSTASEFGKWFTLLYIGVSILAGMKEMIVRFQKFQNKE